LLTCATDESIRVQRGELGQFVNDDTIIELEDGSGYYVTVAAFHGLHCVQRLHHFIYTDDYYSDLSETEVFLLKQHTGEVVPCIPCTRTNDVRALPGLASPVCYVQRGSYAATYALGC